LSKSTRRGVSIAGFLNQRVFSKLGFRVVRDSTLRHLISMAADREAEREAERESERQFKKWMQNEFARRRLEGLRGSRDFELLVLTKDFASTGAQNAFLELAHRFSPRSARGHRKIKVGNPHDGGFVMLDDFEGIGRAFSLGVGWDVTWDLEIAERGIPVYAFDHTVASAPATHPNLHFFRRKIAAQPKEDEESLETLLEKYGANNPEPGAILKMDIEGDEWAVFDASECDQLRRFSQIVCEFHFFSQAIHRSWRERAIAVMEKITRSFQVVHVHGNNFMPLIAVGNVPFPEVLEVTFASKERYIFEDSHETFPTSIDKPNWSRVADLYLGQFKF
jgi:Methyltransferase FkbM domain